ncbi:hypothetical protein CTAYLR_007233 [Chrysophaeum taylorii]|uniref:PA14 domain-containing protein n=1 Tax=Chrysophaeum taylorii TaxID=2483200 RepID=A0AAD7UAH1_9STRA|nr:hypothetical protein CTAYLR_007233 [Chrysophaeum taylorii]
MAAGFQKFDPDAESYGPFRPYERGFVGVVDAPENLLRERANEGSPSSLTHPRQWGDVPERQICPGMVGPLNTKYYCRGKEYGYCDRRTGTCHCEIGYRGIDCFDCTPTHYRVGELCYPKRVCPSTEMGQCSGAGTCNYTTGTCACMEHRAGDDCGLPRCHSLFDELCEECSNATCVRCLEGYFYSPTELRCVGCAARHDPRCHACDESSCLECIDPLLRSIRRSGRRSTDFDLPEDELERELSLYLPYATQRTDFFDEAEPFRVVPNYGGDKPPLWAFAKRCDQGFDGDRSWNCSGVNESHVMCGHEGTISWSSPTYEVSEAAQVVRLTARRTGGGVGTARVRYAMHHVTTDGSDLSATAFYTTSSLLEFSPGIVELSFLVTVHDDRDAEFDETAVFELLAPDGGATLGPQRRATLTVLDDDDASRTTARYSLFGGDWRGVAGVASEVVVHAFSGTGARRRVGGDMFHLELAPKVRGVAVVASLVDLGNGTYVGNWTATVCGNYTARCWLAVGGGLRGYYYGDVFLRRLVVSRVDRQVHFDWELGLLAGAGSREAEVGPDFASVRWTGRLRPDEDNAYNLTVVAVGDGLGARLWIDGHLLIDAWDVKEEPCGEKTVSNLTLAAGYFHKVVLDLRVTRYSGDGTHRGPAPEIAGGRAKQLSFEWASSTLPRAVIPAENLFFLDELPDVFDALVVSGSTSAAHTFAQGSSAVEAGQALRYDILLCDVFGNRRDDVGTLFGLREAATAYDLRATSAYALEFDGLSGIVANLSLEVPAPGASTTIGVRSHVASLTFDRETATTTAVMYPTIAGVYQLDVRFASNSTLSKYATHYVPTTQRTPIEASPFYVAVYPAKALAALCRPTGRGLRHGIAGEMSTFSIVSVDALDNERRVGGDVFEVLVRFVDFGGDDWSRVGGGSLAEWEAAVSGPDAPMDIVVHGKVRDAQNGTHFASVRPTVAGRHMLHVTLNGLDVKDSPFVLHVVPAVVSAQRSTAEGVGLKNATVNVSASLVATARDEFGNPVPGSEADLSCRVVSPRPSNGSCHTPFGNGSIVCSYVPLGSGPGLLAVTYDDAHIDGSPFAIHVRDAVTYGPTSTASGVGLSAAEAGVTATFVITARDVGGNIIDDAYLERRSNFSVELMSGNDAEVFGDVAPLGGGMYLASYNATKSGTYVLEVRDADTGIEIAGSPFSPFVVPTTVSAFHSKVAGVGVDEDVETCRRHAVTVTAYDRFGNQHLNSTERVFGDIVGGLATNGSSGEYDEHLRIAGVPLGSGEYDLTYLPRVAGHREHRYYFLEPGIDTFVYGELDFTRLVRWRVDPAIDFDWGAYVPDDGGDHDSFMLPLMTGDATAHERDPLKSDFFSIRWIGKLKFPDIVEEFGLRVYADPGAIAAVKIDDIIVLGNSSDGQFGKWQGAFTPSTEGQLHDIEVTYQHELGNSSFIRLEWTRTSARNWTIVPADAFCRPVLIKNTTYHNTIYTGIAHFTSSTVTGTKKTYPSSVWNDVAVVEVRDSCANLRSAVFDSDPVAVIAYGRQRLLATVLDHGNSTYTASILVDIAGNYTLVAVVGPSAVAAAVASVGDTLSAYASRTQAELAFVGSQVRGSPWVVEFEPGPFSPLATSASGAPLGPRGVTAGVRGRVVVQARDSTYNRLLVATPSEAAKLSASLLLHGRGGGGTVLMQDVVAVHASSGNYAVDFTLTVAGTYALSIKYENVDIAGSPYNVRCHPAATNATTTSARGSVPRVALAGVVAEPSRRFVVQARDEYRNSQLVGGSIFRVQLRGAQRVVGIADDRDDGTYAVRFSSQNLTVGEYEVNVELANRQHGEGGLTASYFANGVLFGEPAVVRVDPGPIIYDWGTGEVSPGARDHASVRWTGFLLAPRTAPFEIEVEVADTDDVARVFVDGALVVHTFRHLEKVGTGIVHMVADALYSLTLELEESTSSAALALRWSSDEIAKQPIAAYFLFPSSTPISDSPFALSLVNGNATTANDLYRSSVQIVADGQPSWLEYLRAESKESR